ncbi:hypothetical protein DL89DRAFT_160974 [Linderina pennispora]|uniref:Uncharacterized protein n=1 Tax=Linderina pennispora TaxID=61395 RepID=A0A1Y1W7B3_9FUNG|nr:uncharacterized protein DL89DRAFT_160974 [Linderina pennispora]ORX69430.1 hypothetical protein DL89DRAFT_160974 [Linderina pennispora]
MCESRIHICCCICIVCLLSFILLQRHLQIRRHGHWQQLRAPSPALQTQVYNLREVDASIKSIGTCIACTLSSALDAHVVC